MRPWYGWVLKKRPVIKKYHFADKPGCVDIRKNRATGAMIAIYNCKQAGIAEEGWIAICEDHGSRSKIYSSRHTLCNQIVQPRWCSQCSQNQANNLLTKDRILHR